MIQKLEFWQEGAMSLNQAKMLRWEAAAEEAQLKLVEQ